MKRVWNWSLRLIVVLAAIEIGARIVLAVRGEGWDRQAAESDFERWSEEGTRSAADAPSALVPHPYFGFDQRERLTQIEDVVHSSRALKDERLFRVLILGGATAARWVHLERDSLVAALDSLPSVSGAQIELVNLSRSEHKSPQGLAALIYLLSLGIDFDLAIELDSDEVWEVALRNAELGTHPTYPAAETWRAIAGARSSDRTAIDLVIADWRHASELAQAASRALRWRLAHSAALGAWTHARLAERAAGLEEVRAERARLAEAAAHTPTGLGLPWHEPPEVNEFACARFWMESARSLAAICAGRRIALVHALALNSPSDLLIQAADRSTSLGYPIVDLSSLLSKRDFGAEEAPGLTRALVAAAAERLDAR